ncbi:MAG: hypothetical protein WC413_01285 [Candidatus Nanoarchaeia archaeon]
MKKELIFAIFLIFLLSLVSSVNAAHTAIVDITPKNLLETNISNFSIAVFNFAGDAGINNITLVTDGFVILEVFDPIGLTWVHVNDSTNIMWYGGELPVGFGGSFQSKFQARRVSSDAFFTWTVKTKDNAGVPEINSKDFTINVINDATSPILGAILPQNNTFTNNLSRIFSIDANDPETGIETGNLSYAKCGNDYVNQSFTCSQTNCNHDLDISGFNDGDDLCYFFTIFNKGGSSSSTDLFLLNLDRSGPVFDLTDLKNINNTNDLDGIFEFNYTTYDEIGVENCSLILNDNIVNTVTSGNMTYDASATNDSYTYSILCYDKLGNFNETPTYKIYHDTTAPTLILGCDPLDNNNTDIGKMTCNITVSDVIGVDSCSLYINDILDQKLNGANIGNNFTTNVLASNDNYSRYVKCNDSMGNEIITNKTYFYYDNIAPIISNINNNSITSSSVEIVWNTNELSNSSVNYGTILPLASYQNSNSFVLSHSIPLSSLTSNTTYYYVVTSSDKWGNTASSIQYNFNTAVYLAPAGGSGGGGGGGGGGGSGKSTCTEKDYNFTEWSECVEGGKATRSYTLINKNCIKNTNTYNVNLYIEKDCYYISANPIQESVTGTGSEVQNNQPITDNSPITGFSIMDLIPRPLKDSAKHLINLLLLLVLLIALYVIYQKKKYPKINQEEVNKVIKVSAITKNRGGSVAAVAQAARLTPTKKIETKKELTKEQLKNDFIEQTLKRIQAREKTIKTQTEKNRFNRDFRL